MDAGTGARGRRFRSRQGARAMVRLRVYPDTSVFGGCFDDEFGEASREFFRRVAAGTFLVVLSDTTLLELQAAPERVRRVVVDLPPEMVRIVRNSAEVRVLRDAYLAAGVVAESARRDAEHVAAATVGDVDLLVSWNFRHVVNYARIDGYNGVNLLHGYRAVRIFSPREVIGQ
jgi:hypothetical protein